MSVFIIIFADLQPGNPAVTRTLAVGLLMAVWWITEALPLAVTSLIPVALFPVLGIMNGQAVSATYFNHVIFLFLGGFLIALAMERWNLHRRIALKILLITGVSPGRILMGFMLATAFISMWISNTASTMMMLPILMSIIAKLEESVGKKSLSLFSVGLLLSIAYASSIGGIATLVGTPPNLSFVRIFHIYFPDAPEISFARWFLYAFPMAIVLFLSTWVLLYLKFKPDRGEWKNIDKFTFRNQLAQMGPMSYEEKVVLSAFVLVAILWLFRIDISIGHTTIPGWSSLFGNQEYINDGTVATFIAILLFVIPSRNKESKRIMVWETAKAIPWNIILLFGGGFALASGFKESGLSTWFGEQMIWVTNYPSIVVVIFICLVLTFLTELTSNTATTEMILPILAGIAISAKINPLLLMLPATISCSMAFMLPVATPPNAIVFGTNRLSISQMATTGLILNLIGVVVITVMTYLLGAPVFDIQSGIFPDWAVVK
jgi:sodium-dependent dicarboxylate transporter 2/3/5